METLGTNAVLEKKLTMVLWASSAVHDHRKPQVHEEILQHLLSLKTTQLYLQTLPWRLKKPLFYLIEIC